MPLFQGLGIGTEKNAIVIDIGTAYTKCGFAGENGPHCIVPSEIKSQSSGKIVKIADYVNSPELSELLKDFLSILYFRQLLVNPKERRVVVCESILTQTKFRNTLAHVFFKHFEVPSVLFAAAHLLSLLTLGIKTGLVMDAGYSETLVLPVYEGIPILRAWQSIPHGGKLIHSCLGAQLSNTATVDTPDSEKRPLAPATESLTEAVLEDIKVRCCFVTNFERAQQIQEVLRKGEDQSKFPTPPPGVQYPLDGGKLLNIDGTIREHTCEVLFELDNELMSVATLFLQSLLKCPIDTRKTLADNIVIIGGSAMIPGFYPRILSELNHLLTQKPYSQELSIKKFSFHQPPAKENYVAWLGGAMIGSLETLGSRSISRDSYFQTGKIPDWCNIFGDQKEEKVSISGTS